MVPSGSGGFPLRLEGKPGCEASLMGPEAKKHRVEKRFCPELQQQFHEVTVKLGSSTIIITGKTSEVFF